MDNETGDAGERLSPRKFAKLRRRQRLMFIIFFASMILFIVVALGSFGEQTRFILWLSAILLIVIYSGLQFTRRCPRCGANIGWQTRLKMPSACARCGTRMHP
jgi:hypothetical protein